jgi:hypothetical protein
MADEKVGRVDEVEALGRLLALARQDLPPPEADNAALKAYSRFRQAADHRATPVPVLSRPPRRWWVRAPLFAAACTALAFGVYRLAVPQPLAMVVEEGAIEEGGYVRADSDAEPRLRFSDGTLLRLGRSSRVRVAETRHEGARVLLEEGRAHAEVVPRRQSRWVFDAGPCRVQVTGTRFDMRWSAADQVLEVLLYSGSVTVKGPPAQGGVSVRAGQRLTMDVRRGSVRLADLFAASGGAAENARPPAEGPRVGAEPPPPSSSSGPAPAPNSHGRNGGAAARRTEPWPTRVLAGEFRSVIDDAERRGLAQVLAGESEPNVMALADAARYAGSPDLAKRSLLRVRARFPGSPSARRAAFLLGRMAEDQDANLKKALDWYAVYLADAPSDSFRAEALGRQMTATLGLSGVTAARPLAEDYLRRHPRGAYAEAARAIVAP